MSCGPGMAKGSQPPVWLEWDVQGGGEASQGDLWRLCQECWGREVTPVVVSGLKPGLSPALS